jgi:hypothetical protein
VLIARILPPVHVAAAAAADAADAADAAAAAGAAADIYTTPQRSSSSSSSQQQVGCKYLNLIHHIPSIALLLLLL